MAVRRICPNPYAVKHTCAKALVRNRSSLNVLPSFCTQSTTTISGSLAGPTSTYQTPKRRRRNQAIMDMNRRTIQGDQSFVSELRGDL
jgi:hypothetical protein